MPIDYSKTPLTIVQAKKTRQAFQEKIESDVLAVGGSITIETSDWSSNVATKTFANMGQYDFIDFYPATTIDKTNAIAANLFVSSNGNEVTFTAVNTPSSDITFNYKITRGKA